MRRLMLDDTTARMYVLDHMREHIDVFQEMFVYSWRRQLEATLSRFDREVSQRGHEERHSRFPLNRCLGFVDMVSYTSSSTILGDALVGLFDDRRPTFFLEALDEADQSIPENRRGRGRKSDGGHRRGRSRRQDDRRRRSLYRR